MSALAPVAVLGMEGAGKSTFVDALLGEVVPREDHRPGTVAPTVIRWGRGDRPTYAVLRASSQEWTICEDVDQFRRFLLQRFNRDNVQSVAAGLVEVAHPALADGLILVDTPGLNSLAHNVRDVSDAVLTEIRQAVLVVRQRDLGPTFGVVRDRGLLDTITAVVVNTPMDTWLEDDDEIARLVDEARTATVDLARQAGLEITGGVVHMVHLPSLTNGALAAGTLTDHPLHRREVDRLGSWLARVIQHELSMSKLAEAARILLVAAAPARKRLTRCVAGLRQILAGKPRRGARTAIEEWRSRKVAQWDTHGCGDARRGIEQVQWEQLDPYVRKTRDELLSAARRMDRLATIGASPSTVWQEQTAREKAVMHARDAANAAHKETTLTVVADLRVAAQQLVMEPPVDVAAALGPLAPITVTGDPIVTVVLPADAPDDFLELFSGPRAARRLAGSYRDSAATIDRTARTRFTASIDNAVAAFRQRLFDRATEYTTFLTAPDEAAVHQSLKTYEELLSRLSQVDKDPN